MTPALERLLAECEAREPRLVAIIREMDEDREALRDRYYQNRIRRADARIDALARGED